MALSASLDRSDTDTVVRVSQVEIDQATADVFAAELRPEHAVGRRVIVDLSSVSFIASSGIEALVRRHQELQASGVEMVVTQVQPPVRRVIELLGLTDELGVDGDGL
jgi:anti-anti-sigma factor